MDNPAMQLYQSKKPLLHPNSLIHRKKNLFYKVKRHTFHPGSSGIASFRTALVVLYVGLSLPLPPGLLHHGMTPFFNMPSGESDSRPVFILSVLNQNLSLSIFNHAHIGENCCFRSPHADSPFSSIFPYCLVYHSTNIVKEKYVMMEKMQQ